MSEDEIEQYRSLPSWPGRVASVHTFPREERSSQSYRFDRQRFTEFGNTVLLVGSESPEEFRASTEILHSGLPNSLIHVLWGQAHSADVVAPEMVASALIEFVRED